MEPSYLRTVHVNHPILLSLHVQIVIDCNHYIRSRLVQKKCFSQTIIYVLVQYRRNISFKPLYTFSFSTKEIFLSNHYIRSFSFSTEEIFLSNHYIRSRLVQKKYFSQTIIYVLVQYRINVSLKPTIHSLLVKFSVQKK